MKRLLLAVSLTVLAAGLSTAVLAAEPNKKEAAASGEGNLKIWEWANFLLLAGGLGYLIRKHAGPYYAARAAGISKDLVESERTAEAAAARAAEVDRRLASLDTEIAALRAESQKESAAEVERFAQQTAAEIAKIGALGEQEIRTAQKAARLDLQCYAAQLAVDLAEQKVRARMDADTEDRLVGGFVRGLHPPAVRNLATMPVSAVATRYANALADVVTAAGSALAPQDALGELRSFASALESPELRNALITPAVPPARKRAVIGRVADILGLSRITRNFLFVLIDRRRIAEFSDVVNAFEQILDERLGFARAQVASARELTEEQRAALTAVLEKASDKRLRAQFAVDASLIGGVLARIGSTVYDGSVRGQLQTLRRRLSAESSS